jgi:hypothetical protein
MILSLQYMQIPCRKIHVKHEEPIWMETETAHMNETQSISYAAHDHDPNCADICRSSKHVPSLQIIVCGRLCTKARAHTPSHKQEKTCAQALKSYEDVQSVQRIMRQQLKVLENFSRRVHFNGLNRKIPRNISCMVLKAFWAHLSQKFCLLSPNLAHLCLTPSTFENSTFFVRSQHTKKSHPAGLIRKRREIPHSIAYIRPNFPWLRQTDRPMFSSA